MTDERWQKIKAIFHEASDSPVDARLVYLEQACAGDAELRKEVETLLAADELEDDFLAQPLLPRAQNREAPTAELRSGQMIGHYQIERRLGAGGMGVVYLARDTQLGRRVALKLLRANLTQDPARVRRFQQEARAASALNHPNIITIYDVGQTDAEMGGAHFIAAEFVDGRTLREQYQQGTMTLSAALNILIQVAVALAAAHDAGIIHRDIKPENIMLRPDGIVKVLDFGLAKLTENSLRPVDIAAPQVTTQPGIVMGTVSYMSPEQARGLNVDTRSDLFSLGVVMYELLTGHAPFEGETTADVLAAVLNAEPRPLTRYAARFPVALQAIADRALAKSIAERYQDAREIGEALKRLKEDLEFAAKLKGHNSSQDPVLGMIVGSASDKPKETTFETRLIAKQQTSPVRAQHTKRHQRAKKFGVALVILMLTIAGIAGGWQWYHLRSNMIDSLAIMPFANVGNDPQMEYLPDGITESLIHNLTHLQSLRVMARSTVYRYKGQEIDPRQIGAAFQVRALLLGRVQQRGLGTLIDVELVDARDGSRLWGDSYQRPRSDILTVQDEILRAVSKQLGIKLTSEQLRQLTKHSTTNTEAYHLYLQGRYHQLQESQSSLDLALDYFQKAIALDPGYAPAHTGIAEIYMELSSQYVSPSVAVPKARESALRALALDDQLAEAHHALADIKWLSDWDWAGAEREFKRALELNPRAVLTLTLYADFLLEQRRFDEALQVASQAYELDPFLSSSTLCRMFLFLRRYDQCLEQGRKTLEMNPTSSWGHLAIARCYSLQGRYDDAIAAVRQAMERNRHDSFVSILGYYLAQSGRKEEAQKYLAELEQKAKREHVSQVFRARLFAGLGEKDRAIELLHQAYAERTDHILAINIEPFFDSLRTDARFIELVRGIGLTP